MFFSYCLKVKPTCLLLFSVLTSLFTGFKFWENLIFHFLLHKNKLVCSFLTLRDSSINEVTTSRRHWMRFYGMNDWKVFF